MGERPIAELQFADFITCPFDVLMTVGAKTHWRSGIRLPIVVRAPFGGGVRGGPFHSSSPEGWFVGTAGLKVVCPASVEDAYGLLRSAIDDDDPVVYFEHKALYRRLRGAPPEPGHRTPIGRARIARPGSAATIATYGACVDVALRAAEGLDVEILDLRTVWPLDGDAILSSLAKTSRILVLQEAARSIGAASHVLSLVAREGFELLDAPPVLVAAPDTPVPFAPELEDAYIPSVDRVRAELDELLAF
jgi:2-oxoisovalerate dehydrogenase E1 component beta subunit